MSIQTSPSNTARPGETDPNAAMTRLLHLGCGLNAPPHWVNVDGSLNAWLAQHPLLKRICLTLRLVPRSQLNIPWPTNIKIANLRRRLPFDDCSFDAVYASHTLEHLYRDEAVNLLKESHRVLRRGGVCRMLVPDLKSIIQEYHAERTLPGDVGADDDRGRKMCRRLLMHSESAPRRGLIYRVYTALADFHDHKWMYDGVSVVKIMKEAGFAEVREVGFRESAIPHLDQVELEGRVLDGAGVIAEGVRP